MATAISAENFKTALGECYDAVSSADLANAQKWYRLAAIQHAGLSSSGSIDGASISRRQTLAEVKAAVDDLAATAGIYEIHSRWVP